MTTMMIDPKTQPFWQDFLSHQPDPEDAARRFYESFKIGNSQASADFGADLILKGIKTATSSLLLEYQTENRAPPQAGSLSIVENGNNEPICVVETVEIVIKPFSEVDAPYAYDYGEWDRTLETWRRECWADYSRLSTQLGQEPTEAMLLVFERFKVIYPCEGETTFIR